MGFRTIVDVTAQCVRVESIHSVDCFGARPFPVADPQDKETSACVCERNHSLADLTDLGLVG